MVIVTDNPQPASAIGADPERENRSDAAACGAKVTTLAVNGTIICWTAA